jgi:hypothetical protein
MWLNFFLSWVTFQLCCVLCSDLTDPPPPLNAHRRQPKSFRKSRWCRKTSSVRSWCCVRILYLSGDEEVDREESSLAINEKENYCRRRRSFFQKMPQSLPSPFGIFLIFFFFCFSRPFFSSESAKVCFAQSVATAADQCGIGSQCKPWFVA